VLDFVEVIRQHVIHDAAPYRLVATEPI